MNYLYHIIRALFYIIRVYKNAYKDSLPTNKEL